MKTIWKYIVPIDAIANKVSMPRRCRILPRMDVVGSGSRPSVAFWAEVDPTDEKEEKTLQFFGTGHPIPENTIYLGTVTIMEGEIVLHLHEVIGA